MTTTQRLSNRWLRDEFRSPLGSKVTQRGRSAKDRGEHRQAAGAFAEDLRPVPSYNVLVVVSCGGEHHNAANTTLDFLGNRGRIRSLRLHPHAEADKKAINGNIAASGAGRTSARLFRSRRRKGR
jgi:hypothetical protein